VAERKVRAGAGNYGTVGLSLSMLLATLNTSSANAGLPELARAFAAPFQEVQWIVLAYLLAITTLIVSVGRLGDILGKRRLLTVGLSAFGVGSLMCGLSPTLGVLVGARVVQGLGAAVMMALSVAFVAEAVPKEKTGSAMGLLGSMSALGTALGPSLGGLLIGSIGWRAIFLVNVPLVLFSLLLVIRYLPAAQHATRSDRIRFDSIGTAFLALTLASYALAMTLGRGSFGPINLALIAGALVGLGIFIRFEEHSPAPLVRLNMFRDRPLSGSLMMSGLVSTVMMATLVVGPFYLAGALGLSTTAVGLALSVGPLVVVLTGVPAGKMADRMGAVRMTAVGLAVSAVGAFAVAVSSTASGIFGYLVPIAVLTTGYSLFQTSNNAFVMTRVAAEQRGVVSGMLSLSRNLGLITGASLMGAVFAIASRARDVATAQPQAIASGMRLTFAFSAVLIGAALVIAYATVIRTQSQPAAA
jgi:EmrB/QacA subfamily drug resistance transporter